MTIGPVDGRDYPRSVGEMLSWFSTDADCRDYLAWLRWPDGFACPRCEFDGGWLLGDERFECEACGFRPSVTAGTIFDRTRTPLTVWFNLCWQFATAKDGISAVTAMRAVDIGSYQTAWALLHRLRSVLVRPGRERLAGMVEVDETFIGGEEPGLRGGRQRGKKVLVGVAVERLDPKGFGRARLAVLANAEAPTLRAFLLDHVEPGSTVVTDGWAAYRGATAGLYGHQVAPGRLAVVHLPGVHRIAALVKRWLLSTHQGSVDAAHLPNYLDEFVFRFNRRGSRSRGLLFYRALQMGVGHEPVRYRELVANPQPKKTKPTPPGSRGTPPTLERPPANNPWRAV